MPRELEQVCRLTGHNWQCSTVDFHPAAAMLVSGGFDRTIRVWDVEERAALRVIDRSAHAGPITCVRWHPNGALMASTSSDNTTCLWDASTGERMRILREHFGWVLQCSFAPDRTKLATASWDKTVRIWDPNTGELISTLRGHTKGVWACEFYPVGHTSALLASAGEDATARLWDTRTRKVALTLSGGHADAAYSVAWSNDGSLVATGSADRTVTIWDPKAGKILRLLKAHDDTVKSTVFCPINQHNSSNILASAGGSSAILWNPSLPNNNLLSEAHMHDPGKEVEDVAVSHDGKLLATAGRDGAVCVARVPPFRNDPFEGIDPSARRQTKAAESWLRHGKAASTHRNVTIPDLKPLTVKEQMEQESVRLAMQDERGVWLRRNKDNEGSNRATDKPPPRKTNASKLLQSRGFNSEGFSHREEDEEEEEEGESEKQVVEELDMQEVSVGTESKGEQDVHVEKQETGPKQAFVPLKKTSMLDDQGKVHPMVAAAKKHAPKEEEKKPVAPAKAANVDDLMSMLREKTEGQQQQQQQQQVAFRRPDKTQRPMRPRSSVEELLDYSRPVLERRPRVPTTSTLYPKDEKGQQGGQQKQESSEQTTF